MPKYGKRKYTMNKQALGEALKERLAKIQLEKQKTPSISRSTVETDIGRP
jgi:hypothetical protein